MMSLFYAAAALTVLTTALAITRANPVNALLFFVVSLLGMAVIFFTLGAPFAAALEVIVYAGAIVVLFLFVVMMLNIDAKAAARERDWMGASIWALPVILVVSLGGILAKSLFGATGTGANHFVPPQAVGLKLFTTDLAAVELASMLLLAGLVAAFHLGRKP